MNVPFVITLLFLGLQITAAEVHMKIYTSEEMNDECTWSWSQIFGYNLYLAPSCSEYWFCDNKFLFSTILQLVRCTDKAKYFDPYANNGKGVTLYISVNFFK